MKKETMLKEGERIVGVKSRLAWSTDAYHYDFQFVIGRLV